MEQESVRVKWLRDQRRYFNAQLTFLNTGVRDPYSGMADTIIFENTVEAKNALAVWIEQIDQLIGREDG